MLTGDLAVNTNSARYRLLVRLHELGSFDPNEMSEAFTALCNALASGNLAAARGPALSYASMREAQALRQHTRAKREVLVTAGV